MRKWLIGTGLIVLAAAGGYWALRPAGGNANEPPYRTAALDRGRITAAVRATGTLTPVTTVLVGSQLSGQIVELLADYNSQVKAGQVVARLQSDQIRTRRDAAQADLEQAKADLVVKNAQLERARAARIKAPMPGAPSSGRTSSSTAALARSRISTPPARRSRSRPPRSPRTKPSSPLPAPSSGGSMPISSSPKGRFRPARL